MMSRFWETHHRALLVLLLIAVLATRVAAAEIGSTNGMATRIPVAVAPFERLPPTGASPVWEEVLYGTLCDQLASVRALRVLPQPSIDFALSEIKVEPGQHLGVNEARKFGQIIEAERVVCASCEHSNRTWIVAAQVIGEGSSNLSGPFAASSTNWFEAIHDAAAAVVHQIGITPNESELERMKRRRPMASDEAFEMMASAQFGKVPIAQSEAVIRHALTLDPMSPAILVALANLLICEGKYDEAVDLMKLETKVFPDSAVGHNLLGAAFSGEALKHRAQEEFLKAMEINPDDPQTYILIADIQTEQSKWDEEVSTLQKAVALSPYWALAHADLGRAYAHLGARSKALDELAMAGRYDIERNRNIHIDEFISEGYQQLGDFAGDQVLREIPRQLARPAGGQFL